MQPLSSRQVHLDFHTGEHIPDVGRNFDAGAFAGAFKAAGVNSVTVFARCHHGWLYYPSEAFPELEHPNLACRDLMLRQVDALHAEGIRAPVYITVQWDYFHAATRPEWLIRKPGGAHEGDPFSEPGFYQSLCVNTGYKDFLARHTAEVCRLLGDRLDGVFFDIVGLRPCWCAACRAEMKAQGVDTADEAQALAFAWRSMNRFKEEMSALVRGFKPDATVFYNAGHVGPATRASAGCYSHFELESLPSGSWGYLHFPVSARYARTLGRPCLGMTGKFHTEWGDFHSLKNQAALEFECFRMLSYGFACSVGDQLEPAGTLNPATYKLIGAVYHQVARREAWAMPSRPVVEAALLTGEDPLTEHQIPEGVLGAAQLLEELALQFDIIDPQADFSAYPLLIVPDDTPGGPALAQKLDAYVAGGGKVLACGRGGLAAGGQYPACYGVAYQGESEPWPDFVLAEDPLAAGLEPGNEYVVYQRGVQVDATSATAVLPATAPFFSRRGDRFCSHRYTPSAKKPAPPAALQNGGVLFFRHPLFSQYRANAPRWCKTLVGNALDRLLPSRLVRVTGPSTLTVTVLEQPEHSRYALHLLSYVPVRKSAQVDIIEERTPALDVELELVLPKGAKAARLVPEDIELSLEDGRILLPKVDGYAIVEVRY